VLETVLICTRSS